MHQSSNSSHSTITHAHMWLTLMLIHKKAAQRTHARGMRRRVCLTHEGACVRAQVTHLALIPTRLISRSFTRVHARLSPRSSHSSHT